MPGAAAANVASRYLSGEPEPVIRRGFARLFEQLDVALDADDPVVLMIFPEMDATVDVPEDHRGVLGHPRQIAKSVMCATSRMVVKYQGAVRPTVIACTVLGPTLANAASTVPLNHPHCAKFCVLGGAACSRE
jgi:hypothetical protein